MHIPILVAMILVGLQAGVQSGESLRVPPPPGKATAEKPWPPAGVVREGPGVTTPRLIKEVKPSYTAEAMRNKVQGVVFLEAVVTTDGTVGEVRVKRSLDKTSGLDEEAVNCVKKWIFAPGTKDGVTVPVLVDVEMSFTLGPPSRIPR
jgi:periplasmic protein TonB